MLSEEQLLAIYNSQGIVRYNSLYLEPITGSKFITDCQENNLAVIGIEGFILEGKYIIPQEDLIADFSPIKEHSWEEYRNNCNRATKNFIQNLPPRSGLVLDFTIYSEEEFKAWLSRGL